MQPEDTSSLIEEGLNLFELGKYEESLLYFDKSLALEPGNLRALGSKGATLGRLGRYEEAITYFVWLNYYSFFSGVFSSDNLKAYNRISGSFSCSHDVNT